MQAWSSASTRPISEVRRTPPDTTFSPMMLAMSSRSMGRSWVRAAPSRAPAAVITLWILASMVIMEPEPLAVPPKVLSRSPLGRMES